MPPPGGDSPLRWLLARIRKRLFREGSFLGAFNCWAFHRHFHTILAWGLLPGYIDGIWHCSKCDPPGNGRRPERPTRPVLAPGALRA